MICQSSNFSFAFRPIEIVTWYGGQALLAERFLSVNDPSRTALSVGSAALWLPALGAPVFIEVDAVPYTARVPRQEFVIPHLAPSRKFLEPLRVAELPDQIVLCELADTGFEFVHSRMAARHNEKQEATRKEERPCPCSGDVYRLPVQAISRGCDLTACIRVI
jgi:hypothetical protein